MDTNEVYPLILTLELEPSAQLFFNNLRKQYFPPDINYLDAHLTLFHNLPAAEQTIYDDVEVVANSNLNLQLQVNAIVSTGNGTAYKTDSSQLAAIHLKFQNKWKRWLIPQDKQRLWPHITVQNKVSAEAAKELQQTLKQDFHPFEITATGLSLWEYRGGPWQFVKTYSFAG